MSVDTGAREPALGSALLQTAQEMRERAKAALADRDKGYPRPWGPKCYGCGGDEFRHDGYCSIECREFHNDVDVPGLAGDVITLTEEVERLAAGVGVPPPENQDSVGAPARERQDAREPRCHRCGGRLPLEGEPYDVRVTDYCCAKCAVEVGAGVGEARPAADASRTVDGRELNPWGVEGSSVQESAAPPRITVAAQRVEHQGRVYIDADDLVASLRAAGWGQLADDFFRWRVGVARPAEPPHEHHYMAKEGCPQCEALVGAPAEEQPDAREPRYISTPQKVVELQAECARLRMALDASAKETGEYRRFWEEALRDFEELVGAVKDFTQDDNDLELIVALNAARAALGVVAAGAETLVANSAKNAEVRGGDNA